MMNQIIQSLYDRKSVRVFEERPISAQDREAILLSAFQAPSAGNQQMYTILDITDQSLKDKLAQTCDHQPFIAQAPLVLIFCADMLKWLDAFEEGGANPRKLGVGDLMIAFSDAMIAAQNAVVAAESLGIGSCYIGDIMEHYETHRQMLNLPKQVVPVGMLVFGYPTQQQKERKKPIRAQISDIVMENTYTRKTGPQLREMLSDRLGEKSFEEWIQAFCKRRYDCEFSRELTRSVAVYLKDFE